MLPVLAFTMAESVPRLWRQLGPRFTRSPLTQHATALLLGLYVGSVVAASGLVHLAYDRWGSTQAAIQEVIHETTGADSILITNWWATKKFTRELDRRYVPLDRDEIDAAAVLRLASRHPRVFIALLDRSDSAHWLGDTKRNAAFVQRLEPAPELAFDRALSPTDHLRIWRVRPPGDS
jgi:hypothetical protein